MRLAAIRVTELNRMLGTAETFARSNVELAAIALVGITVFLLALWLLVRWIRRPVSARLMRALDQQDEVAILMHPNPDPDAMACAIGIQLLADRVGTETTLQYPGQVRHQENRAFQTVLDLEMEQISSINDLASPYVVLVDHNTPRGFEGAEHVTPYAVIDHHPGEGTGEAFTDIRTEYGACASIIAEYLKNLGAQPDDSDDQEEEFVIPLDVATGLLYGIQSDTKQLTNGCVQADFKASSFLYEGIDEDSLDRIANPQMSVEVLEAKANAIWQRDVRSSFAISDIGEISNVDAIPQAADELMQLEGVTAVVVYGRRNGTLHFSGRSRDDRVHMGKTLKAAIGDIPNADAGGHARMGGGQMPAEQLPETADVDGETVPWTQTDMGDQLFNAMNGDV